ncbi:uncharacterized protein UV8b_04476 [Ustilaginoidea virens]|uniref:Uncharacterized protein n=1 Tax=Ustilaginoidea virens TaxID=1159556 RepID=A0A8E5HRX4_USTVR|nr:uncharacterized protein UV8b_04476 [Ustilaginoidea virens]QUC20235.1 hypothetical protein UV8b_04476 [Ustilaginoidea virens]
MPNIYPNHFLDLDSMKYIINFSAPALQEHNRPESETYSHCKALEAKLNSYPVTYYIIQFLISTQLPCENS